MENLSREHPYDASKDSVLCRARGVFTIKDMWLGTFHRHAASPPACHQPFSKI